MARTAIKIRPSQVRGNRSTVLGKAFQEDDIFIDRFGPKGSDYIENTPAAKGRKAYLENRKKLVQTGAFKPKTYSGY